MAVEDDGRRRPPGRLLPSEPAARGPRPFGLDPPCLEPALDESGRLDRPPRARRCRRRSGARRGQDCELAGFIGRSRGRGSGHPAAGIESRALRAQLRMMRARLWRADDRIAFPPPAATFRRGTTGSPLPCARRLDRSRPRTHGRVRGRTREFGEQLKPCLAFEQLPQGARSEAFPARVLASAGRRPEPCGGAGLDSPECREAAAMQSDICAP